VVSISILIALGASVILIAVYGIIYTLMGLEGMNPFKFGMRMLFAMMATYYLPYLMQDILNINNVLVLNITTIDPSVGNAATDYAYGAGIGLMYMATAVINSIILTLIATGGTASLLWLIVIITFIVMIIKPMLQIIMWWYLR